MWAAVWSLGCGLLSAPYLPCLTLFSKTSTPDQHATHPEAGLGAGLVQSPFQGCQAGAPVPGKLPLQLLHIPDASLLQGRHGR